MAAHQSHNIHPDGVQLALALPGFDFTPPKKDEGDDDVVKIMPQVATTAAGQLRLKLDR